MAEDEGAAVTAAGIGCGVCGGIGYIGSGRWISRKGARAPVWYWVVQYCRCIPVIESGAHWEILGNP